MRLLATLHRWTGGIIGLLLAVIGLSGTALVWEEAWVSLPGAHEPYRSTTADLAHAVEVAADGGRELARVTFAGDETGLNLAIYRDGGGAYIDQAGRVVDAWSGPWGRPELWLFDLHHHLLLGETGETITGVLGLLLIGFVVTGGILWWRTRRTFAFRLWPKRLTRSAIIRQHRDLGVVAGPMLLLSACTGTLMLFAPLSDAVLAPWGEAGEAPVPAPPQRALPDALDYGALMEAGQAAFPGARARRIQFPGEAGRPVLLRLKQDFEWTPNGRSYVYLDPATARVVGTVDPAGNERHAVEEKLYPVHAGKVGGIAWKLLLSFGGLTLVMLGILASWSFWFRRGDGRAARRPAGSPLPAE